ncbi:WD40-repeat-containing domain protein [Annulohypoxylon moriforme]|nr:WD40-repeat-containing domain protein [Annulohypoxylon moriforme]
MAGCSYWYNDFHGIGLQATNSVVCIEGGVSIGSSSDSQHDQCIANLRTTDPRADKRRIESTKGGLLRESYCWILEHDDFRRWRDSTDSHLLWIKGDPGKGKTMLLCGIIDEMKKQYANGTHLLPFFFCQATDKRLNNATGVLRSLIYLLIMEMPSLISYIKKKYDQAGKSLFEDVNAWFVLSDIFIRMIQDPSAPTITFVIDALDECETDLQKLLGLIMNTQSIPKIKWLLSSRNKVEIERTLLHGQSPARLSLELKGNADHISHAVNVYIDHCISGMPKLLNNTNRRAYVRNQMRRKSNGTFLWVSLVAQKLKEALSNEIEAIINAIPAGLVELYQRMLEQATNQPSTRKENCLRILSIVTATYRPLCLEELAALSGLAMEVEEVKEIVKLCGSFLTILGNHIFVVHQSAQDFLRDQAKSTILPRGIESAHHDIFFTSLRIMFQTLERDVYRLNDWGISTNKIKIPSPDPLVATQYSCIHWVDHLVNCRLESQPQYHGFQDGGIVDNFLQRHYLHWLEALSILNDVPKGISAMATLSILLQNTTGQLREFVKDAARFIRFNKLAIESSPLQVYGSALVFSPSQSVIRRHFQGEEPPWLALKPTVNDQWGPCLASFEHFKGPVQSVTFSPDGNLLAVGAGNATVWDVATGRCIATCGKDTTWSVAFSPDGGTLGIGTESKIMLLDIATDRCKSWESRGYSYYSVVFSPDGRKLASGSGRTLSSGDRAVKLWDVATRECTTLSNDYGGARNGVAFSSDGRMLAWCSTEGTIIIRDTATGKDITLGGEIEATGPIAFSPDRRHLASCSGDKTIKIWDIATGESLTLEGHNDQIYSVASSPDGRYLVSGSQDMSIKIWDTQTMKCLSTVRAHNGIVKSVAFSPDGSQLVSGSNDETANIWDTTMAIDTKPFEGHNSAVRDVEFSLDGVRMASGSEDGTIKIWNTASGSCVKEFGDPEDYISVLSFSHDRSWLASSSCYNLRIWDVETGSCIARRDLDDSEYYVTSVIPSPDGKRLLIESCGDLMVWDIATDQLNELDWNERASFRDAHSYPSSDLGIGDGWLQWGRRKLLWMPSDYFCRLERLQHAAAQSIGVGCENGRVWMLTIRSDILEASLCEEGHRGAVNDITMIDAGDASDESDASDSS